jgi:phosphate transport system protein
MLSTEGAGSEWDADRVALGRHFVRDMEHLWEQILKLAAVVETALTTSVKALIEGRPDLVAEVHGEEEAINDWEVQIELDCLKVLALHNPVASDLRRVAAVLKINGDLERIGDLADHIASRARKLANEPAPVPIPPRLETLANAALAEVRDSLDALAKSDPALARAVIEADRGVDRHRRAVQKELKQALRQHPERVNVWLRLINTARNLERVADHATNIAEAVVYLKEGRIIRHDRGRPLRSK